MIESRLSCSTSVLIPGLDEYAASWLRALARNRAMLIYRRTGLLESPAQTLVNTVNCFGVMGKGLAHAFKERDPAMFAAYKRVCDQRALAPGKLWLWRGGSSWVLNFPTKIHWRNPSRLEWIEQGLEKFVSAYEAQGISSTGRAAMMMVGAT